MVARILTPWYRLGQDSVRNLLPIPDPDSTINYQHPQGYPPVNFDSQRPDGTGPRNLNVTVRTPAHTALVREIASASAILLKNQRSTTSAGVTTRGLPVALERLRSIAIVGQDAKIPNLNCGDLNKCNDGTMSIGCVGVRVFW